MIPNIINTETALKLGVVGCIRDPITTKEPLAEYLLWALNK